MKSLIDFEPGIFYVLGGGHAVTKESVSAGPFSLGTPYQLNTMFQMWELMRDGKHVGFYFHSGFKVLNKGGFIVTFLESKRGKADSSRVVLKQPELVVYDLPGCGSMAISTKVNDRIKSILMEQ